MLNEWQGLEEQLVDLSSLLYDYRLQEAYINSTDILEGSILTQQYVDHLLEIEREGMKCCRIEYLEVTESSQSLFYAVILIAGFFAYFLLFSFYHMLVNRSQSGYALMLLFLINHTGLYMFAA